MMVRQIETHGEERLAALQDYMRLGWYQSWHPGEVNWPYMSIHTKLLLIHTLPTQVGRPAWTSISYSQVSRHPPHLCSAQPSHTMYHCFIALEPTSVYIASQILTLLPISVLWLSLCYTLLWSPQARPTLHSPHLLPTDPTLHCFPGAHHPTFVSPLEPK